MRGVIAVFLCVFAFSAFAGGDRFEIASAGFASDANNLSTGTVNIARLPIGKTSTTVASGDDVRFNSISRGRPEGTVDNTRVLVWVE